MVGAREARSWTYQNVTLSLGDHAAGSMLLCLSRFSFVSVSFPVS